MADDPTVQIRLTGSYDFERVERMIAALQPLFGIQTRTQVELDMSGMVFIGPTSLSLLEAALRTLEQQNLVGGGWLRMPNNELTRNYLHRMDFFEGLASLEKMDEPFTRRPAVGFRPCSQFKDDKDYSGVAKEMTDALVEGCQVQSPADAAIRICLDELTENVIHHADSQAGGFAAAQGTKRRSRFEVGIADLGIGIRGSLAKNPRHAAITSDLEAITKALEPFVTSTPVRNLGTGLFITRLLLQQNGGDLLVRSGYAHVRGGATESSSTSSLRLPGTVVALRARTDRLLDLGPVYDELLAHEEKHGRDDGKANDPTG